MAIYLYNTLTRQKEEFKPLNPPNVSMYVCGPTVYNFLHVGNFRGPVVFNLLRQWLEYRGYKVKYVLNFTDVDDKIIQAANEQKSDAKAISEKYIEEYKKDFSMLGLKPHEVNPKVSETMDEIIAMIARLVDNRKAYVAGGDVWYSVRAFDGYGKLSGRKIDDLMAGARVEVNEQKKDPADFALWKAAKPGEPAWDSPWGGGRPGWHIECSAMACKHLGEQIDIHGGGTDLMFPHHENEIAQSEGALNKRFVGTWIHWNMLNFGGQKMSKSLGNFTTMRAFLEKHHPEIYKWMILSVHYRHAADFSPEALDRAVGNLARIYSSLAAAEEILAQPAPENKGDDVEFKELTKDLWYKVELALDDDLGTPEAFACVFEFVRKFNSQVRRGAKVSPAIYSKAAQFRDFVLRFGGFMSLFQQPASKFLVELDDLLIEAKNLKRSDIDALVQQRTRARQSKNFAESDRLRDQLTAMGISVSDTPAGTFWEVTK